MNGRQPGSQVPAGVIGFGLGGMAGIGVGLVIAALVMRAREVASPEVLQAMRADLATEAVSQGVDGAQSAFRIAIRCRYMYSDRSELFWEGPFYTGTGMKAKLHAWAGYWARTLQTYYAAKWSREIGKLIYPFFVGVDVVVFNLDGTLADVRPVEPPWVQAV